MILQPGEFNVADYRKAIPSRIKLQVLLDYVKSRICAWDQTKGDFFESAVRAPVVPSWNATCIQFDHNPALTNRPYDTVAGDFVPPQHDPGYIVALAVGDHLEKTTGRKAGAAVTVTTRGSDVGERARTQDIRAARAVHLARLAAKEGKQDEADAILAGARFKKKDTRPKSRIPQRANAWPKGRKLGNRGNNHESRHRRNQNTGSQGDASAGKDYAANGAHRGNRRDREMV